MKNCICAQLREYLNDDLMIGCKRKEGSSNQASSDLRAGKLWQAIGNSNDYVAQKARAKKCVIVLCHQLHFNKKIMFELIQIQM